MLSTDGLVHDRAMPVEAIHLGAPRKPTLWTVDSVQAVAGKGIEGERHFHADGAAQGQALTLVAAEVVEDFGLRSGENRGLVHVRDGAVNRLGVSRLRVGEVECLCDLLVETCRKVR